MGEEGKGKVKVQNAKLRNAPLRLGSTSLTTGRSGRAGAGREVKSQSASPPNERRVNGGQAADKNGKCKSKVGRAKLRKAREGGKGNKKGPGDEGPAL